MKKYFSFVYIAAAFLWISSCTKEKFITSPDARVYFSADTLGFDTVFTSAGSVTGTLKIFNANDGKLTLNAIELMGGSSSAFRINADGTPGPSVKSLEIGANDSLYVFVSVNIDPNSSSAPFIVSDSIRVSYNGVSKFIQLQAYGQNARYLKSRVLRNNTTWDNTLPYVILGGIRIDTGITLTIQQGTRVHLHADAPFIVDGTLLAGGTKKDSITFQGDRLDKDYRDLPASWPGIIFRSTSEKNKLRYTIIKNAYQGIITDQPSPTWPKLDLSECTIDNIYDAGITSIRSGVRAVNCLVSNCGLNILLSSGGEYEFTHCTVASYGNEFIQHKRPVLVISNWDSTTQLLTYPLLANFRNNIFWGENGNVDDEVLISRKGNTSFSLLMENNLYKAKNPLNNATLSNNLVNTPPQFDSIDVASRHYDFRVGKKNSPAVNKGKNASVATDLDGNPRDAQPDIGCYEKQ